MKNTIDLDYFKIYLPDENSIQFYIFCNLAEIFGNEFQSDAVKKLKKKIKEFDLTPKPNLDYESGNTSIRTSNYKTIVETAKIINLLAVENYKSNLSTEDWFEIEDQLKNWKRPKPQVWKENDIFSFKMKDGSFTFGQVLIKNKKQKTFVLFDLKSNIETIDFKKLLTANPLTILHLLGTNLNDHSWKVIGHLDSKLANPNDGPWKDNYLHTATDSFFESIANYHWLGIMNWKNENDMKKLIIKKKKRFIDRLKNWR